MSRPSFKQAMLSRFPLKQRTRAQPEIGEPVLTQSSNERLSGRPQAFDRSQVAFARGLPQIHSSNFSDEFLPRQNVSLRGKQSTSHLHAGASIPRKPTPTNIDLSPWAGSTTTTITAGPSSSSPPFALGHLVKERVTGRRRNAEIDTEYEAAPVRPDGLNTIDDWLDIRADVHKISRGSTVSSESQCYPSPPRPSLSSHPSMLHIRQSTFAPLQASDLEEVPAVPARSFPPSTQLNTQSTPPTRKSSLRYHKQIPPPVPSLPSPPLDHVSQLEHDQTALQDRKRLLRKEIFDLEQLIPETHVSVKAQLKARLEEMNQEYADAEKAVHDTGLALYRAYRRRNKMEGAEGPTHLWVSRVTASA